ncbi:MAG: rhomboid family intramembrane serine protease [Myxococcota bacterium]|nr:rhomboid family intramembrane serine protease [Myxococcota bacterium]
MTEVALRSSRSRRAADEWALVLVAEGLHPSVHGSRDGFVLVVPEAEAERAHATLHDYEGESALPTLPAAPVADPHALGHALFAGAALIVFFLVTGPRDAATPWFARGSADADLIRHGEWWRVWTALTLHADLGHVVSNAVVGAVFGNALARGVGAGFALALVVAAGAAGNALNAWLHATWHVSVGASTAVFGSVGVLAGIALVRRRRAAFRGRRALVPVAAALALLAMLGTGGERVDLWAHGFGLAAGIPLGLAAGTVAPPPRPLQWALGLAAFAALLGAWALALETGAATG